MEGQETPRNNLGETLRPMSYRQACNSEISVTTVVVNCVG